MQLVAPLAAGVNGASGGSAALLKRGTSTPVTAWYRDFEASQGLSGRVTLDANGGAVVYVNELADVQVFDLNGVLLREFVAGNGAPATEVISAAITGTDYVTGQVAANKPTTLQAVLDKLLTSAGTTDFNVLVNGSPTSLQSAVAGAAGIYFNVQSFGAKGDGSTDNASFIQAAVTAAAAAGGGTIFFPPGVYRVTTQITVSANVSVLGCGGTSSKVAIDSGAASCAMEFTGADTGARTCSGMWFGAIGQNFVGTALVKVTGAGGRVDVVSSIFGNDAFTKCALLRQDSVGDTSRLLVDKSSFCLPSDASAVMQTSTGRIVLRDSDLVTTFAGNLTNAMVNVIDGVTVDGCRFDASTVTGGTGTYVSFAPATWGACVITNSRFKVFNGNCALYNRLAAPYYDCWESGNCFGDLVNGSCLAYGYLTDGFAPLIQDIGQVRAHGSRANRSFGMAFNGNMAIDAKAYGIGVISRYAAGAQVFTASKGTLGDHFTLQIVNNSGGVVAPAFGAPFIMRAGYAANINNLGMRTIQFAWLPDQLVGGTGGWVQIGVEG